MLLLPKLIKIKEDEHLYKTKPNDGSLKHRYPICDIVKYKLYIYIHKTSRREIIKKYNVVSINKYKIP